MLTGTYYAAYKTEQVFSFSLDNIRNMIAGNVLLECLPCYTVLPYEPLRKRYAPILSTLE